MQHKAWLFSSVHPIKGLELLFWLSFSFFSFSQGRVWATQRNSSKPFLNLNIVLKAFPALICSTLSNKNLLPCWTTPPIPFLLSLPFLPRGKDHFWSFFFPLKTLKMVSSFAPPTFTSYHFFNRGISVLNLHQILISPQYLTFGLNECLVENIQIMFNN